MQREALTFSGYRADTSQLFQNVNWKNFSTQRDIQKALMVFKSINGLAPEYLSLRFIALPNTTSYTFRDSVYYINTNKIPGELLRKNMISSLRDVKITC